MTEFQEIAIDDLKYAIALPNKNADYIQRKIFEEATPYEFEMLRDMADRVSSDDLILDIGANIGNHTLYLAAVVGCRVHAFEPNTALCNAMRASVMRNSLESKVTIHNVGVGKEAAKAHFDHVNESNLAAQALVMGSAGSEVIDVVKLDDIDFEQSISAIKIDVEGMELSVLQGAVKLIKKDAPVLYVESLLEQDFKEVHRWLSSYGYSYWDTFNATPTHLYVKTDSVTASRRIEQLMAKAVCTEYQLESKVKSLRFNLDQANGKYRDAQVQITELKRRMNECALSAAPGRRVSSVVEQVASEACQKVLFLEMQLRIRESLYKEAHENALKMNEEYRELEARYLQKSNTLNEERKNTSLLNVQLNTANEKYRQVTAQLDTLKNSRSLALARYLGRILMLKKRARQFTARLICKARKLGALRSSTIIVNATSGPVEKNLAPLWVLSTETNKELIQASLSDLRIACIMDEFTFNSYFPECELYSLTPEGWDSELAACRPHLLFIESAWRGKNDLWGSKVGHNSEELQGIVKWSRERNVPTVFWNKEDPVHFETFLTTAKLFDFVFTTDMDCIHRYKAALKHNRVYLLPFACQPRVNNPIEKFGRKDAFCFAGAYYARYPERTKDLDHFIEHLSKYRSLEIYDRNYGKDHPDYQFPESYHSYIVGSLPFEQIDNAYKGYRYAVNLNSIKQSQSMFARRVYELLASNTITVSNYSRGLRLILGDLVVASDNGEELIRRLELRAGKNLVLRKHRLVALRKVMREHTYQDRLAYILAKIRGEPLADLMPNVFIVGYAKSRDEKNKLLAHFERQSYKNKRLLLVVDGDIRVEKELEPSQIFYISASKAKQCIIDKLLAGCEWVAGIVSDDYYGGNYIADLALATRYSDAVALGKSAHYIWGAGAMKLIRSEEEYRTSSDLPQRAAMLRVSCLSTKTLYDFVSNLPFEKCHNVQTQAIDAFNYCKNGMAECADLEKIKSTVDDLADLDEGLPISEVIERAERIQPEPEAVDEAPVISGDKLSTYFRPVSGKDYKLNVVGSGLEVTSSFPDGKHEYLYAVKDLAVSQVGFVTHAKIFLDVTLGLSLQIVLMFLSKDKKRIRADVLAANRNHEVEIPEGGDYIRFGIRIYGGGAATINKLVLGHRALRPAEFVGRSKYLILTNHYPSYDDLYRNAFVHSRVKAYQERGVNVDVFRLRKDEALSYHEFQDVDIVTGSPEALRKLLAFGDYQHVLVHFLDPDMWAVLREYIDRVRVTVWVHGAEVQPWWRREYNYSREDQLTQAKLDSERRLAFWQSVLKLMHPNLKLVFVSQYFAEEVMEDLDIRLPEAQYEIIHNPIDTDLFSYRNKPSEQRLKVLSIRPYASAKYANDLSVKAILALKDKPWFSELEIRIIGDGALFDETLAPLTGIPNVIIQRGFLKQTEIASIHKDYGIFLCPTRMDAQGVSKDEAMSSGLVVVTNNVTAIPEFVDADCGILAGPEDFQSMADGIAMLVENPNKFEQMSAYAAARVRRQTCKKLIVNSELEQFTKYRTAIN